MDFRKNFGPNLGFSTKKGFKIRDPFWYQKSRNVGTSCIKKILQWNLLTYIGLHCVRTSSWTVKTLATLFQGLWNQILTYFWCNCRFWLIDGRSLSSVVHNRFPIICCVSYQPIILNSFKISIICAIYDIFIYNVYIFVTIWRIVVNRFI